MAAGSETALRLLSRWGRSYLLNAYQMLSLCVFCSTFSSYILFFVKKTEMQMMKTGSSLLSSCWKHYGMLMHLEDHKFSQQYKELLDQYLSGIQVALLLRSVFTLLMLREWCLKFAKPNTLPPFLKLEFGEVCVELLTYVCNIN